jgi:hypothetical protein
MPGHGLLAEHGPDADILDILDEPIGTLPAKATEMAATPALASWSQKPTSRRCSSS